MSRLREEQSAFAEDVSKLLLKILDSGFDVTFGEAERTKEMQEIYFERGSSKTMNSMHLIRCAIDLHIFRDGELIQDRQTLAVVGSYWESLSSQNRWGGSWRGLVESGASTFVDTPHFERKI